MRVGALMFAWQAHLSLATSVRAMSVGIEFGLDGVSCSAALSNGTAMPLAFIQGDASYQQVMHGWYDMAAEAAATQLVPTRIRSVNECFPAIVPG